jgi:WD40 repeat protein
MKSMVHAIVIGISFLAWGAALLGDELQGKVTEVAGKEVVVRLTGELAPNVGDKAQVVVEIPGLDEKAFVASGRVTQAEGDTVTVTIERASGKVAKNQSVTINSDAPKKIVTKMPSTPNAKTKTKTNQSTTKKDSGTGAGIREVQVFSSNDDAQFTGAVFSANSREVLAIAGDLITWDIESGELRQRRDIPAFAEQVAFSRDRSRLLTGGTELNGVGRGFLAVWDSTSGALEKRLSGHTTYISDVALSPDGRLAASCAGEINWEAVPPNLGGDEFVRQVLAATKDAAVRIWDVSTGRVVHSLAGHSVPISCVCFSPNGLYLLTAGADRTMRMWDTRTGKEMVRYYDDESLAITNAMFSADGKSILAVCQGPPTVDEVAPPAEHVVVRHSGMEQVAQNQPPIRIRLWDVAEGRVVHNFSGHQTSSINATISPDGRTVMSLGPAELPDSNDSKVEVRLWDTQQGTQLTRLVIDGNPTNRLAFSPDSRYALAVLGTTVRVWSVER